MIAALGWAVVALHALVLLLLLPFAGHRFALLALSRRRLPEMARNAARAGRPPPRVTVQLPVFNEKHVVERLIDAACRLRHPRDRLQIQVLDDSTDETTALAERRAAAWRLRGVDVAVLRRSERTGYKAGALAAGLEAAAGEFVLVLDADFVPGPSLIEELLPAMDDPGTGMVQARWDHLNAPASWLTRAQALLLDGHFLVEQRGRWRAGRFFNFNGTAGLWRRRAIDEAGGWQSDTLTEDLDLSYRAQMAGWRFALRDDVGAPAELPGTVEALLVQQRRWAQGGVETARKVLPRLLGGQFRRLVKFEAFVHLCGHLAHPLTFALSLLIVPSAIARRSLGLDGLWWLDPAVFLMATGPFVAFYWTAAVRGRAAPGRGRAAAGLGRTLARRGRDHAGMGRGSALRDVAAALVLGAGLCAPLSRAALRGLLGGLRRGGRRDPFERTPKAGSAGRSSYESGGRGLGGRGSGGRGLGGRLLGGRGIALAAGASMVLAGGVALAAGEWGSLPFVGLFACGYLSLGVPKKHEPDRKPHGETGPQRLRPDSGGLVGREAPVAQECEAA